MAGKRAPNAENEMLDIEEEQRTKTMFDVQLSSPVK